MVETEPLVLDNENQLRETPKIKKAVQVWLIIGLFMVFVQVVVGGITRLTDSGLSITEW
ncbi:MAG: COX15/CtaA family protein, partial [Bacteroidota bacterium]